MTDNRTVRRRASVRRWRARPLLTALALALGVAPAAAATATPASAASSAAQHAMARPQAGSAPAPGAAHPSAITIQGLNSGPDALTLITGDQVTLTPAGAPGSGRYTVAVRPAPRPDGLAPPTMITASTSPGGASEVSATPADAESYVSTSRVDRGLFDVKYLASHEDGGQLMVDVQFAAPMTDTQLAAAGASLPDSTLAQTMDTSNAAEVNVDLTHAAQFWAAITGPGSPGEMDGGTLADGISAVWLDGHRLGTPGSAVPASDPTYSLSVIIHERTGAGQCTNIGFSSGVCVNASSLLGVQGDGAGSTYSPASYTCVDSNSVCQAVQITYNVPPGVYSQYTLIYNLFDNHQQWFDADDPQIQVGNNTTASIYLDNASQVTINTPSPAVPFTNFMQSDRTTPDGTQLDTILLGYPGVNNMWAVATQPVTIGQYAFKTEWDLLQPEVAVSIHGPDAVQLNPYPLQPPAYTTGPNFQGTQTLPVVDAGSGTASDFASIDAHGKLVLIRNQNDNDCTVEGGELQNAVNVGAVGVLWDSTEVGALGGTCALPEFPSWAYPDGGGQVDIPFAELTSADAQTLRARLTQGSVDITVTGTPGPSPYMYELAFVNRGSVPASLTYTVTRKDLAAVQSDYHGASQSAPSQADTSAFASNEAFTGGTFDPIVGPTSTKVFFGPISPELIWNRVGLQYSSDFLTQVAGGQRLAVYNTAGRSGAEEWFDQPGPPGVPVIPAALATAQPGFVISLCAGCRQGNDFEPWMYLTSRDPLMETFASSYWAGADPSTVQLYAGGQEIPPTQNSYGMSEYTLPAQQTQYRLMVDDANSVTTWDFTSAEPTTDQTPVGYGCAGGLLGISGPCQAMPLVFLRYDAGTGLTNSVTAPAAHRINISAIHLDPSAPPITSLQVWTSVDGGKTWTPAHVTAPGSGDYVAAYSVPQVSATDGSVSLKVQATDAGGNDVSQVITDAFQLTGK